MEQEATYICDTCKENAWATEDKSKHYRWLISKDNLYRCNKCPNYFNVGFRVTDKISLPDPSKHFVPESVTEQCEDIFDGESSRTEPKIAENRPTGTNKNSYKCNECPQTFKTNNSLQTNMEENTSYRYEVRSRQYTSKSNYQLFLIIHSNIKRYKCSFCTAAFKHENALRDHMNIHNEQNPFRCELCGKNCTAKQTLEKHLSSHWNERQLKCTVCSFTYKNKTTYNRHMNVHKEDNPYRCKVCNNNCCSNNALQAHMKSHSDAGPYKCPICGATYKKKLNFDRHRKNKHQKKILFERVIAPKTVSS